MELELHSKGTQQGFNDRHWIWARKQPKAPSLVKSSISSALSESSQAAGVGSFPGDVMLRNDAAQAVSSFPGCAGWCWVPMCLHPNALPAN